VTGDMTRRLAMCEPGIDLRALVYRREILTTSVDAPSSSPHARTPLAQLDNGGPHCSHEALLVAAVPLSLFWGRSGRELR
jgi:hypothetical protein